MSLDLSGIDSASSDVAGLGIRPAGGKSRENLFLILRPPLAFLSPADLPVLVKFWNN
jgi:hypothetical protein